ncbi:MAG: hypothetical protein JW809_06155 [Pirellulales bacterium]|nr:hypothetical protein [Pirellulales bacterium]
MKHIGLIVLVAFSLVVVVGGVGQASVYTSQGPFVIPVAGDGVPGPRQVPGKEYSTDVDRHGNPLLSPDPGQVIAWDGAGGTADSQIDYSAIEDGDVEPQVDALASWGDALFDEVVSNRAALLFCTKGDMQIYYERIAGGGGVWATPAEVNDEATSEFLIDALEVWGGDGPLMDDADRVSYHGDPGGVAVWALGGGPVISDSDIATAIGAPSGVAIDLDALMMYGESILFSIEPVANFDGGEIWVWDGNVANPAQFLYHGGHLWDTAFDVMGTFGTASENIWALEAVSTPEPASVLVWLLLAVSCGAPAWRRWRRG